MTRIYFLYLLKIRHAVNKEGKKQVRSLKFESLKIVLQSKNTRMFSTYTCVGILVMNS